MQILNIITFIIATIGTAIITWGAIISLVLFLFYEYLDVFKIHKRKIEIKDKHYLRQELGSYILLGLEFMIAADIIHTFIKPNKDALIILGSIVAIRTVISYFLNRELKS